MKILTFSFFLFLPTSFSTFSQILPVAVNLDYRLATIADNIILTKEVIDALSEERVKTIIFNLLADTNKLRTPTLINQFENEFKKAEEQTGVPVRILKNIVFVESAGQVRARSKAGAAGLMQLMPGTARRFGLPASWRFQPERNIKTGANYFRHLLEIFGDTTIALATYHMGEGNMFRVLKLALKDIYGIDTIPSVTPKNARRIVETYHFSYPLIYFSAKPGMNLWNCLRNLGDDSKNYFFKVKAADILLSLEPAAYEAAYRKIVRSQPRTYRWFTWCAEKELDDDETYISLFSTKKLYQFLDWPENPPEDEIFGEEKFYQSRESAGAALAICFIYRKLLKQYGVNFQPVVLSEATEVSKKCQIFAFRISGPTSGNAQILFEYVVEQMANFGYITFQKEKNYFLVVVTPEDTKRKNLEVVYCEAVDDYNNW